MRSARLREHFRSNVIGYICLIWLMTGTAVAATQLPAGSVGTKQLRKSAVTGAKVKHDALTGVQVRESSLGTVPNAAELGGSPPGAFQRRVTGTCTGPSAVRQVNGDGTVACVLAGTITKVTPGTGLTGGGSSGDVTLGADTTVLQKRVTADCLNGIKSILENGTGQCVTNSTDAISETVQVAHGLNFGNRGDFSIGLSCGGDQNSSDPDFVRILVINETGGPATLNELWSDGANLHADGTSLASGGSQIFDSSHNRIEGEFILAGASAVTTLNAHAFKVHGGGCEITGTTVKAALIH